MWMAAVVVGLRVFAGHWNRISLTLRSIYQGLTVRPLYGGSCDIERFARNLFAGFGIVLSGSL